MTVITTIVKIIHSENKIGSFYRGFLLLFRRSCGQKSGDLDLHSDSAIHQLSDLSMTLNLTECLSLHLQSGVNNTFPVHIGSSEGISILCKMPHKFLPSPRPNVLCGSRHFSRDGQKQNLLIGLDTTGHMIGQDIIMSLLLQTQFQARWLVS